MAIDPNIIGSHVAPAVGFSPLKAIKEAGTYADDQQKRRDDQAKREDEAVVQAIMQQHPEDPDTAIKVMKQKGFTRAAMGFQKLVTEERTKMSEFRGQELENLFKSGQVSAQQVEAEYKALTRGREEDWRRLYDIDPEGAMEKAPFMLGAVAGAEMLARFQNAKTAAFQANTSRMQAETDALAETRLGQPKPPEDYTIGPDQKRMSGATNTELARGLPRTFAPARPVQSGSGATSGQAANNVDLVADAIVKGEQSPEITGMYGNTLAIRAALAKRGYDHSRALEDWRATQRYLLTLNGAQQTRLRQAVTFTRDSLDVVQELANEWDGGGFPLLNKGHLALAKNGAYGPKAASVAQRMDAQIADIVSELGTVYKGGNSSTDESLKLAAKNLQSDWSKKSMTDAIALIRKNLNMRENSIRFSAPIANEGNRYAPDTGAAAPNDPMGIR